MEVCHSRVSTIASSAAEGISICRLCPRCDGVRGRLQILDREGMANAILYPTSGLLGKPRCSISNL